MQRLSYRLNLALNTSKIGVWELNLDTLELTWDDRMRELYGIADDVETIGVEIWSSALHPDDRIRAEQEFDRAISTDSSREPPSTTITS